MELLRNYVCYVPTLRFKKYDTNWDRKKLSDYVKKITRKNSNNVIKNVICNSAQNGLIPQLDFFDKEIANNENTAGYYIISNGDFVYNPRKSLSAPYGPVNIYKYDSDGIVSPLYLCFSVDDCINKSFLLQRFKSPCWYRYIYLNGDSGARHDRVSIKDEVFLSQPINLPKAEEQAAIAEFLEKIDERISVQNKIISDLKVLKKEIMDYILNTCDFMELSIKDLIDCGFARIIKASEMKKFNGTRKYLSTSSIGENGIEQVESIITYTDRPSRASMLPIKGSIWFAKMKNSVKVYQSTDDDENLYILSTGFYGLLCDETKVNSHWIIELFKSDYFNTQKDKFSEGSSMSGIKDSQLADITLKVFADKKQEKYHTNNIQNLSKKIQLEKNALEVLLKQKQFFLNAMFI